jgi:UDP-glucuronate 4-epimerase
LRHGRSAGQRQAVVEKARWDDYTLRHPTSSSEKRCKEKEMGILVTGGAGFIGSHLLERLLREGHDCVCLDNFDDFYAEGIKRANLRSCMTHPRFRLVEADIRDAETYHRLERTMRVSTIVHLAAKAGVRPSLEQPVLYEQVNVHGTAMLLDFAWRKGIDRFVFASSSSVYGNNEKIPFHEDDRVDWPISPYAATKKAGELLAHTYAHLHGIACTCLRFFTVYGPRQRPEMAVHKFTRKIDAGEPVPVFGDGSSERDYTYISDIIDGVMAAVERLHGFQTINLGDSRTVALKELVRAIEKALGKEARLDWIPEQPGDVRRTCADIRRAGEKLGYVPRVPIEEGIFRFVEWYRARKELGYG